MDFIRANKALFYVLASLAVFFIFFFLFFSAPADFPVGTIFTVEEGSSLRNASFALKEANIIRSRLVFEAFVIIFDREKGVVSSDYYFENKLPVFEVARRIVRGEHHLAPIVVTIPEGFDTIQIADTFTAKLENFNRNKFLLETQGLEGYLFPDTYLFIFSDDEKSVIKSMRENFEKKIAPIRPDILLSHKTEKEIIIMASLIEGEAKGDADRGFISGILWKRIKMHMPLQVDVAPETYKKIGLPKSPIGNPGLAAIMASIYPKSSPYLYYLHDKNGVIYYAKTFAEHRANIVKYLK